MSEAPFNPDQLVKFMTTAGKTASHNAAMKAAFKKLQASVNEFAAIFADEYEPVIKERTKRGEGRIAKKKAAAAAGNKGGDLFKATPVATSAVPAATTANKPATAAVQPVNVVKIADQKK